MKIIEFVAEIVDQDNEPIHSFGKILYPIYTSTGTIVPSSQSVISNESVINDLSLYCVESFFTQSFCCLSGNYSAQRYIDIFPDITALALTAYSGYFLKLTNKNGTYALGAINASGGINTWSAYDDSDTSIGFVTYILPGSTVDYAQFTLANYDNDGKIASFVRSVRYKPNTTTNWLQGYINISVSQSIIDWVNALTDYVSNADPYEPGGESATGGGTGNFDLTSDQIDVPNVPTLSAVDTGLVTLYTPTLAQLQALAQYLWNANATTIDWWKKLIANPLDLILGLSIVPVAVPQGTTENVRVGLIDTGVAMTKAASQYVQIDCGSLNITEFYGAALDYLPFRKTSIYLPFIGTRTISTDDIMGKTVQVVYNIDLLSGALTAMVKCGDAVLYQYSGACNIAIPLSGQSFTDLALSTLQLAAGIGATVATGGAAAGVVAANAANSVMSMKPTIERAGGVSGAAGQLAVMRPYLIGEIPRQSVPANYNQFAGYPSNISAVLGDLSGYTEAETIYLEGITATSDELNEIETLLKSGVYI